MTTTFLCLKFFLKIVKLLDSWLLILIWWTVCWYCFQVCELHVAGYKFSVLNNAFLVHHGLKTATSFHETKDLDQERNRLLFRQFKTELREKYPESSRRCYWHQNCGHRSVLWKKQKPHLSIVWSCPFQNNRSRRTFN